MTLLALAVRERLALDPESGALFVFASKRGNRLKEILLVRPQRLLACSTSDCTKRCSELPVADAADRPLASIDLAHARDDSARRRKVISIAQISRWLTAIAHRS